MSLHRSDDPFPHLICNDAFRADRVAEAAAAWPAPDWVGWVRYAGPEQRKRVCFRWEMMPPPCRLLLGELATLQVWEDLGLPPAVPDLSLWGGGLHDMRSGDFVGTHLDHDVPPARHGLARACSAVLFLGAWERDWGGELELYPGVAVEPRPGRLVAFASTDEAWHAVAPLRCPPDVVRMTLAVFWYAKTLSPGRRPRALFAEGAPALPQAVARLPPLRPGTESG